MSKEKKPTKKPSWSRENWPLQLKDGSAAASIYFSPSKTKDKVYDAFTLNYSLAGKRVRRVFSDLAEAKAEGRRVLAQMAQGSVGAAHLTGDERHALQAALSKLAAARGNQNATIGSLAAIVEEYAAATAKLPADVTLAQAAEFYRERNPAGLVTKTVAEVVDAFIEDRRAGGCSAVHLRDLGVRLGRFKTAFHLVPINSVSAPQLHEYVYSLTHGHTGKPSANRSKENTLRQIVSLFNFARRMKFIPADLALEVAEIPTPKKQHAAIEVFTPAEIARILAAADAEIIPALAIAAFAGLRLAEVARLDWRDVKLSENVLVVTAGNAKTRARRVVPIAPSLAAWLNPHAKPFGPVNPCADDDLGGALGDRFERAAVRAKIGWRRNALRHSAISYRVALTKDVAACALEFGNSPAVIFSSYRALATEAEGKAWFAVEPAEIPQNVVALSEVA
jgi:integrase